MEEIGYMTTVQTATFTLMYKDTEIYQWMSAFFYVSNCAKLGGGMGVHRDVHVGVCA